MAATALTVENAKSANIDIIEDGRGSGAVHEMVTAMRANRRTGTAHTKTRGEVAGHNAKPWRQKGTGRARAGRVTSPIWRGGGTVHGPRKRDFSYHMPAKARRVATRSAIAGKLQDGEVVVAELGGFSAPSSKSARKVPGGLGSPRRALLVLNERNENVYKSFRNFPGVKVRTADELCAFDVVAGGLVIAEAGVLEKLSSRVGVDAASAQDA